MAGEADIWQPRTIIEAKANTQSVQQRFIASDGQSLFVLTDFAYTVGTGALEIYKNGSRLARGINFVEQTTSTFALVAPATAGDEILAIGFVGISGTVSVRDTDIYLSNHQALRDYAGTETTVYIQGSIVAGDGGEGFYQKFIGGAVGQYVDNSINIIRPTGGDGTIGWIKSDTKQISVGMFAADTTGTIPAVAAFQSAINATPNSGVQEIRVEAGTYLGDMTTLTYGSRIVIFKEEGSTTYLTAAPTAHTITHGGTNGINYHKYYTGAGVSASIGFRADISLQDGTTGGLPYAMVGRVDSYSSAGRSPVGVYGQGIAYNGSTDTVWGMVAEAANSRPANTTYGVLYPTTPSATIGAVNGIEVDSVHTGPYNDTSPRATGIQVVAFGGTESTNGIEVHASQNSRSHSHDGTAQAGGASTITLAADARATSSYYNDSLVYIISGTGAGQERKITAYNGATKIATVDSAWVTVPDATSVYVVYDIYKSGMFRNGLRIYQGSLNDVLGNGILIEADAKSGILITGDTNTEDFGIRRVSANQVNIEFHTGISANNASLFTQNIAGGDSASASSDITYIRMQAIITDNTAGSQDAKFRIAPTIGGIVGGAGNFFEIGNGIAIGSPTSGPMGNGTVNAAGNYYKQGVQVVTSRRTGWAAATGTATRTTFDTATVTTAQLAERVKAVLDDLITHGLIGA